MKKVLYKKWIPLQYEYSDDRTTRVQITGTGRWEDDFTHSGELLTWGVSYEEFESGAGNYTIGIIMNPDRTVEEVLPSNIKFIVASDFPKVYTPPVQLKDKNI